MAAVAGCGSSATSTGSMPRSRRLRAEAESAFGDGTVFVEPYVERGRHVEVQVVGDCEGTIEVFGERDCSLQRRHQKVVEESPAPHLPPQTRRALHDAARAVAAAVKYVGAGTVEFLYDGASDRFYFLEMNTRLQVEHPVTEEVHRVDLVALQIAVAEGRPVPSPAPADGHAIEARLYAEDPAADYQPQSGRLTAFDVPPAPGVRLEAGFVAGNEVTTFYDAMLAKIVVHAPTREQAARTLAGALARARIHGVTTNRDQLVGVLRDPGFLAGDVSTAFLDEHPPTAITPIGDHAVAAALALAERDRDARTVQQRIPVGWRNVVSQPQRTEFQGERRGRVVRRPRRLLRRRARRPRREPDERDAGAGRCGHDVRRRDHRRRTSTSTHPRAIGPSRSSRGSATRRTRSPVGACSPRCPAPSSVSRWRRGSTSTRGSRCSCSRR